METNLGGEGQKAGSLSSSARGSNRPTAMAEALGYF